MLWLGKTTRLERMCLRSFLQQGHAVHLYVYENWVDWCSALKVYTDAEQCPARLRDASEIVSAAELVRFQNLSNFSDYFRYQLLYQRGGWWSDLDVFCLRPFDLDAEYVFSSQLTVCRTADEVNNTVMRAPKGSELMKWSIDRVDNEIDTLTCPWPEIGPHTMNLGIDRFNLQGAKQPHERFCPLHYFDAPRNYLEFGTDALEFGLETLGVHLWNEEMRRAGADKDGRYPGSLYEKLLHEFDHEYA